MEIDDALAVYSGETRERQKILPLPERTAYDWLLAIFKRQGSVVTPH